MDESHGFAHNVSRLGGGGETNIVFFRRCRLSRCYKFVRPIPMITLYGHISASRGLKNRRALVKTDKLICRHKRLSPKFEAANVLDGLRAGLYGSAEC